MLLTGTYNRSLDEKHRVAIPKRLRVAMKCPEKSGLYLAPGTDKSLALYSEEEFARLADRMALASPNRPDVRAFQRMLFTNTERVEPDRQGRIRIPSVLVQWAELAKEVILLGVRDHIELWAVHRWEVYRGEQQANYDQIASTAYGNL